MDLADATLIGLVDAEPDAVVFTLDSHFRLYRTSRRRAIRVVPDEGRSSKP